MIVAGLDVRVFCSIFSSLCLCLSAHPPLAFLDALASLKPILFTEWVIFFGLQITSESLSENVIGLCQIIRIGASAVSTFSTSASTIKTHASIISTSTSTISTSASTFAIYKWIWDFDNVSSVYGKVDHVRYRRRLKTIDNNGQQWTTMENNGQQWTAMDNNGQQCTSHAVFIWYPRLNVFKYCAVLLMLSG